MTPSGLLVGFVSEELAASVRAVRDRPQDRRTHGRGLGTQTPCRGVEVGLCQPPRGQSLKVVSAPGFGAGSEVAFSSTYDVSFVLR